jgi:hypothetical protein
MNTRKRASLARWRREPFNSKVAFWNDAQRESLLLEGALHPETPAEVLREIGRNKPSLRCVVLGNPNLHLADVKAWLIWEVDLSRFIFRVQGDKDTIIRNDPNRPPTEIRMLVEFWCMVDNPMFELWGVEDPSFFSHVAALQSYLTFWFLFRELTWHEKKNLFLDAIETLIDQVPPERKFEAHLRRCIHRVRNNSTLSQMIVGQTTLRKMCKSKLDELLHDALVSVTYHSRYSDEDRLVDIFEYGSRSQNLSEAKWIEWWITKMIEIDKGRPKGKNFRWVKFPVKAVDK